MGCYGECVSPSLPPPRSPPLGWKHLQPGQNQQCVAFLASLRSFCSGPYGCSWDVPKGISSLLCGPGGSRTEVSWSHKERSDEKGMSCCGCPVTLKIPHLVAS